MLSNKFQLNFQINKTPLNIANETNKVSFALLCELIRF